MSETNKKTKKLSKAGISAFFMFIGACCFTSLAGSSGPSSDVWIDVVQVSSEQRVSVTVPFSYGFAVLGTTDINSTEAISTDNNNLLMPNVRVKVTVPSDAWNSGGSTPGTSEYELEFIGQVIPLQNYSTDVREENLELEDPPREGIAVELNPYIEDSNSSIFHYWELSATAPTAADGDFKKYRMILDGMPFSIPSSRTITGGTVLPVIELDGTIELPAPPDVPTNGHTAAGTANIPSFTSVDVDVEIGGRRGQYKQVEESVNIAWIVWEVTPGELPPITP